MTKTPVDRTEPAEALTNLILTLFRVNNRTLAWGDRLVAPLGLTSARWQVLGAIAYAERPQPVAWLARDLGVSRQNVQRIVNDLRRDGIVAYAPNPHHLRAHLVVMTETGQHIYDAAIHRYNAEVNALADGLSAAEIETAHHILRCLHSKLEGDDHAQESS